MNINWRIHELLYFQTNVNVSVSIWLYYKYKIGHLRQMCHVSNVILNVFTAIVKISLQHSLNLLYHGLSSSDILTSIPSI